MRLTPEQSARLDIAMTITLRHGAHEGDHRDDITRCEACALEVACWVMTGTAVDETPDGASALLAVLPILNDGPWRDDEHRTSVIRPYLPRLLTLDPADDQRKAYALADYAVRVCAAEAIEVVGLADEAAKLRPLAPIVDEATANAAADATYAAAACVAVAKASDYVACAVAYAASASANAARAANDAYAARAVGVAAVDVGYAANAFAYAAGADACADADATIERHTRAILDIICGPMEVK